MTTEQNSTNTNRFFKKLDFKRKLRTIWNKGNFINSHITSVGESEIINFYKLNDSHVEIVYSGIGTKIKKVNFYEKGKSMETFFPVISTS
ncbi:MAG: hypothetical protein BM563_10930 [Bacteroidetes bacterium MedPE-SWsnd-G1]|uniref:Uncharacterized protein n=1 Tax=Urechidicola vernalis TaxID=3075600 RepID=A0ABU2Y3I3_9FLAO|nr:hypothetical protein [Urechidicola sp. P050]MDT0551815.1 hypothetical protein [Urechidicola sp. P050]OIQ36403.1 MAG: hypothetical protein BM563_10930 [Bacteroidetes bacterium MedPE-SWsnd-G1]